jgi:hypothetical protein
VVGYFGAVPGPAWRKDRGIDGGPLAVRGTEYPKGLGTRSQSELAFDLQGGFRRFQSLAAIDDSALGGGSARFVVEVDGRRVFASDAVTGTSPPLAIGPFDVAGRNRLLLKVEFGELADVNDRAAWCDALLIR